MKNPGPQRERLVREIVRVEDISYDEACKITDKIQKEAGTGVAEWAFPYNVMMVSACASPRVSPCFLRILPSDCMNRNYSFLQMMLLLDTAAFAAIPLCFHLDSCLLFNEVRHLLLFSSAIP